MNIKSFYIYRLFENAYKLWREYGVKAFLSKSKKYILYKTGLGPNHNYDLNKAYAKWLERNNPKPAGSTEVQKLKYKPLVSILMPVWNVELHLLKEAIQSVQEQSYTNWELCIADDFSPNEDLRKYLATLPENDKRIKVTLADKNLNISGNTNRCLELASGEYIYLMDNDDTIEPDTLYEHVKVLNDVGKQDLIYADEDKLSMDGQRIEPYFKPDYSEELLWSQMYMTRGFYDADFFKKLGAMRIGYEGSQDYDLALRAVEMTDKIYHIPKILYHWRKIPGSTADKLSHKSFAITSAKKALQDAVDRRGLLGKVSGDKYPFALNLEVKDSPSVEIIIPTKDKLDLLKPAVDSIIDLTTYENYHITVVDNGSVEKSTLDYFEDLVAKHPDRVEVLSYDKPFNYSAINNFAVKNTESDYLVFLNNDTKVISANWIEKLLVWAQQEEIGAVGCKLLYPNHLVQHAGVVFTGTGGVKHAYQNMVDGDDFYFNNLNSVRNYLAITAACMMVRREVFESVGGFNEKDFAVAYNDIDLCLKIYEAGFRNVYTPEAKLYHYESQTRKPEPAESEVRNLKEKWGKYFDNDPYYNPNFDKMADSTFRI